MVCCYGSEAPSRSHPIDRRASVSILSSCAEPQVIFSAAPLLSTRPLWDMAMHAHFPPHGSSRTLWASDLSSSPLVIGFHDAADDKRRVQTGDCSYSPRLSPAGLRSDVCTASSQPLRTTLMLNCVSRTLQETLGFPVRLRTPPLPATHAELGTDIQTFVREATKFELSL